MKNERTSKRVAKIAGEILAAKFPAGARVTISWKGRGGRCRDLEMSGGALNSVAASALTQAPDKPKKKGPHLVRP